MVQILTTLKNKLDIRKKRKLKHYKKPLKTKINEFVMRNFGILLLLIVIFALLGFVMFSILVVGSSLESGNYYNHLGDIA